MLARESRARGGFGVLLESKPTRLRLVVSQVRYRAALDGQGPLGSAYIRMFHPESRAQAPSSMAWRIPDGIPGREAAGQLRRGTSMEQLENAAVALSNSDGDSA